MDSIESNVKRILNNIAEAAIKSGRSYEDITLVAASKMNSAERVREAFEAGIRVFGENRVQEMEGKMKEGAYENASLHFIGHLQRNKVKNVVGTVDLIQSAGSLELMRLINTKAESMGIVQNVLLEINVGGEESKSGVSVEEAEEILSEVSGYKAVSVKGLMAIPPASDDSMKTIRYFDIMHNLFVDIGAKKYDNISMDILSMGMSSDYREAILAGANMVRVGSGIFGARIYSK